jgi:hypothetical protein
MKTEILNFLQINLVVALNFNFGDQTNNHPSNNWKSNSAGHFSNLELLLPALEPEDNFNCLVRPNHIQQLVCRILYVHVVTVNEVF